MNPLWWLALPVSALLGAIPFSWLLPRLVVGRDVRHLGSGNVGATNATRAAGRWVGAACLLLDGAKGALPVLGLEALGAPHVVVPLAAFAAILGHSRPLFLKGAGGKGVATTAGAVLALSPESGLAAALVWAGMSRAFRMVSLASVLAALALPGLLVVLPALAGRSPDPERPLFGFAAALWIVWRHRANLRRILEGTEPRMGERIPAS